MYHYELHQQADGATCVWQERPDGGRYVSDAHHGYLSWLAAGGVPTLRPYSVPPPPPPATVETQRNRRETAYRNRTDPKLIAALGLRLEGRDADAAALEAEVVAMKAVIRSEYQYPQE